MRQHATAVKSQGQMDTLADQVKDSGLLILYPAFKMIPYIMSPSTESELPRHLCVAPPMKTGS